MFHIATVRFGLTGLLLSITMVLYLVLYWLFKALSLYIWRDSIGEYYYGSTGHIITSHPSITALVLMGDKVFRCLSMIEAAVFLVLQTLTLKFVRFIRTMFSIFTIYCVFSRGLCTYYYAKILVLLEYLSYICEDK